VTNQSELRELGSTQYNSKVVPSILFSKYRPLDSITRPSHILILHRKLAIWHPRTSLLVLQSDTVIVSETSTSSDISATSGNRHVHTAFTHWRLLPIDGRPRTLGWPMEFSYTNYASNFARYETSARCVQGNDSLWQRTLPGVRSRRCLCACSSARSSAGLRRRGRIY
jgi:hypothetical protein